MPIETEVKFKLTPAQYEAILKANENEEHTRTQQVDTYYTAAADISMRIREETLLGSTGAARPGGATACLTIKSPVLAKTDNGIYSSQEVEPQLPGQSATVIKKLLQTLGVMQDVIITKTRREYTSQGCKMALDGVELLGYFMEIEVLGESEAEANAHINDIIKQYGFDSLPVAEGGYPSLLKKRLARL